MLIREGMDRETESLNIDNENCLSNISLFEFHLPVPNYLGKITTLVRVPASGLLRGTAGHGRVSRLLNVTFRSHHSRWPIRRGGVPSGAAAFIP